MGVDDLLKNTDLDNDGEGDGFTDIPPLLSKSLETLSMEKFVKIMSRLQNAFIDLHLKGKKSAAKILTKKKAEKDPNVEVFMSEGTK